jgi:hypothetical protein
MGSARVSAAPPAAIRYFEFGPRWKSLREISFGEEEALALLELPEEFAGDWVDYHFTLRSWTWPRVPHSC